MALGAARGEKTDVMEISLPGYTNDASDKIRRDFVQIYIYNRGQRPSTGETIQILENRPPAFKQEFGTLIEDIGRAPVYVTDHASGCRKKGRRTSG